MKNCFGLFLGCLLLTCWSVSGMNMAGGIGKNSKQESRSTSKSVDGKTPSSPSKKSVRDEPPVKTLPERTFVVGTNCSSQCGGQEHVKKIRVFGSKAFWRYMPQSLVDVYVVRNFSWNKVGEFVQELAEEARKKAIKLGATEEEKKAIVAAVDCYDQGKVSFEVSSLQHITKSCVVVGTWSCFGDPESKGQKIDVDAEVGRVLKIMRMTGVSDNLSKANEIAWYLASLAGCSEAESGHVVSALLFIEKK